MTHSIPPPGRDLIRKVRIGFIAQGTTFTSWCRDNDIRTSNARAALMALWNGPKGQALRKRIVRAARLRDAA